MKLFIILLLASFEVFAGTCTSISRTNFAANSVLTSTALNSQFNTVYNHANDLDGGCVTDGTLESSALNTSDFAVLLKGTQRGCKVNYSSADTLSISKCLAGVNGNFVATTSATSVTWGCDNCAAESASQNYYVYIATGSSGTTLTPLLSTTAPNDDGYDNSGNLVLAKFRNAGSGDIDQYSIDQWLVNKFVPSDTDWASYTPDLSGYGTVTEIDFYWRREGKEIKVKGSFTVTTVAGGSSQFKLPTNLLIDYSSFGSANYGRQLLGEAVVFDTGTTNRFSGGFVHGITLYSASGDPVDEEGPYVATHSWGGYSWLTESASGFIGSNQRLGVRFEVPIQGWGD